MQEFYFILQLNTLSNMKEGVLPHFQKGRRELKIKHTTDNFLKNFEVFGNVVK